MEVIKLENKNGQLFATTREIAISTNKKHKHVLEDMREEFSKAEISAMDKLQYVGKNNRTYDQFVLDEYQTLQLMSRYSQEIRKMVINEFKRMKEYIKSQQEVKQELTTKDILKLATAEIQKLETQLIETTERKNEVTNVLNTIQTYGDNILFREFVKIVYSDNNITISEKEFRSMLKKEKYIDSKNFPYAKYKQYFNVNKGVKNGKPWTTTRLTAKGQLYFTNKLVKMFEGE